MKKKNISQEFRSKNIDETRNYFLEEIEQNEWISRKDKKVCAFLNYIEHFLILASAITECISISAFTYLLAIPDSHDESVLINNELKEYEEMREENKLKT